ncbi:hypothetical protein R69927_06972 [Paraburkholderia domus]|jgi:hypothetical protein|nr:hypothetical protein R69749_01065 [Paraburkholderia domus]CAE6928105.1 hypothetical protein R69927_06972 [Paraburkholderia domus]CAE6948846.1 hypothetical protein R70199_06521 [Paraburkholderia domus]CAE6956195.1 hypothetical protein R75471_06255 [Paraburkholderia domus]
MTAVVAMTVNMLRRVPAGVEQPSTPAIAFAFPTDIRTSIPHRIADLVARISVEGYAVASPPHSSAA